MKIIFFISLNSEAIQVVKDAYLEEPEDLNIIGECLLLILSSTISRSLLSAVDWGEMAGDNNYLKSAASTRNVGRNIAMVIDHMVTKKNARPNNIHLIGHSLGLIIIN